jgi:hypothetical protein
MSRTILFPGKSGQNSKLTFLVRVALKARTGKVFLSASSCVVLGNRGTSLHCCTLMLSVIQLSFSNADAPADVYFIISARGKVIKVTT